MFRQSRNTPVQNLTEIHPPNTNIVIFPLNKNPSQYYIQQHHFIICHRRFIETIIAVSLRTTTIETAMPVPETPINETPRPLNH
jgi:hypothetical protein